MPGTTCVLSATSDGVLLLVSQVAGDPAPKSHPDPAWFFGPAHFWYQLSQAGFSRKQAMRQTSTQEHCGGNAIAKGKAADWAEGELNFASCISSAAAMPTGTDSHAHRDRRPGQSVSSTSQQGVNTFFFLEDMHGAAWGSPQHRHGCSSTSREPPVLPP